jgi:hypothetical protein
VAGEAETCFFCEERFAERDRWLCVGVVTDHKSWEVGNTTHTEYVTQPDVFVPRCGRCVGLEHLFHLIETLMAVGVIVLFFATLIVAATLPATWPVSPWIVVPAVSVTLVVVAFKLLYRVKRGFLRRNLDQFHEHPNVANHPAAGLEGTQFSPKN